MRVLISAVSLAALLLAHLVPTHHAHSHVVEPSEISARPHFHLHHWHDDNHHSSAHDVVDEEHGSIADESGVSFPREHDDDAVYIDVLPGLPVMGADSGFKAASGAFGNVVDCGAFTSIALPPPEAVAEPPPPAIRNNLPLYLRTLSLRI